ncbi:kinase-like domain-containing protein, partial [Lactarius deliciosus]
MLLDHRADANLRNDDGQTPLHLLSGRETCQDEDNCSDIAMLLLERGANVNPFDARELPPVRDAFANGTQPVIPVKRAAPQSTAGGSAHIPAVSVGGSAAPTTSAPLLFPVAFCTPSRLLTPSKDPDRSSGCESGGDGAIKPASTWWGLPKRKPTIPVEQTERYTHTRSRAVEAIGGALGTVACIGHELLFVGVDLLQFVPVPGLELAGKILLNIWDAVEIVETNRIASLRLTERCADVLISVRGEIVNAGYTVAEELRAPIAKLVEAFGEVHHFLENLGQRPFLKRFLRRDETLSSITACDTSLNNALELFSLSIQIRTLKLVQANELQRQKETRDLFQSISHLSPGLPPVLPPLSPATLLSSPVDPESVRKTLHALRAAENVQDRAHDVADLRQLMQTALATNDDVAMIEVLQIARSEMPEAIKTLQRALERVVEDEQLDAESATARLLPPSSQQDARKGTGPSVDPGSTGAGRHSAVTLDREFIETGIGALRRLSKGTDLFLPSWTITWYEIDLEAKVGVGFFSDVYRGTWLKRTVAVKVLAETTPRKIFVHEVEIWKSLYHPNVLELFGASSASGEPPWFLVSKYYPRGSLVKYLKGLSDADATRVDALKMIHEISNGMEYLHNRGVLHGDLKAANILVDNDLRCVISDFGQSEMKSEVYRISRVSQPRGTLRWQAPELMQGAQALTPEMDVYAFAICCVEILTMGALPWPLMDDDAVRHFVLNENMRPSLPPSNLVNGQLMNVIRASWDTVPSNRPSFKQSARELNKQRAENIDPPTFDIQRPMLQNMLSLPLDVLFGILSELLPMDLLNLARTSNALRQVLMSRKSTSVWIAARRNAGATVVPDPPEDMSEPAWAQLLFGP